MSRNADPVERLERRGQQEAFKRQQNFQILRIAENIERDSQTDGFKEVFHILSQWLENKKEQYGLIKDAPIREILKDRDVYLLKRATLEAEIEQLKAILKLPGDYKAQAEKIRKSPDKSKYRGKEIKK